MRGPAATTISVEVEEARLGQSGDGANDARRAVAVIPGQRDGQSETEQELMESGRHMTEDERVVKTFNATVPGSVEVRASPRVKVETPAGTVWAADADNPRAAREADKGLPAKPKR
ncbi:hypothetical protein [Melittangium boletus]|uniref:hypothetical protein n=1 Tax=Melittangium boletus TaxID=83453 RepID=UPI003DA23B64